MYVFINFDSIILIERDDFIFKEYSVPFLLLILTLLFQTEIFDQAKT